MESLVSAQVARTIWRESKRVHLDLMRISNYLPQMQMQVTQLLVQSQALGIGLLVTLPILWALCWHRGVDVWKSIAVYTALLTVAAIGGRIWAVLFSNVEWFGLTGFGSMGAIGASGVLGIFLWHSQWRPIVSVLVPPSLLLIGFLRLGCVFQGCDRGRIADWGFIYFSENVSHLPFPAFDAANGLFAAIVSLFNPLLGIGTYLGVRLGLEFFRDPKTTEYLLGLNRPQWALLLALGILAITWRRG